MSDQETARSFQRIVDVIDSRQQGTSEHAAADCALVTDLLQVDGSDNTSPLFFYGVAHILKHLCRRKAFEFEVKARKNEEADGNWADERKEELVRIVGWADEFFWLSVWSQSGRLIGRPDLSKTKDPHVRFIESLIQVEWGELGLVARRLLGPPWNIKIPKADEPPTADPKAGLEFGIWRNRKGEELEDSLRDRAKERFLSADQPLEHFRAIFDKHKPMSDRGKPGNKKSEFETAVYDAQLKLFRGYSGIERSDLGEIYRRRAKVLAERLNDTSALEALQSSPSDDSTKFKKDPPLLTSVNILGEWIGDLLRRDNHEALHPRLSLFDTDPLYGHEATNFPNLDAIRHLEDLLGEHCNWLNFVSTVSTKGRKPRYLDRLKAIEDVDDRLRAAVFQEEEIPECPEDSWQLFILRDWGSYTPLLPVELRRKSQGGESEDLRKYRGGGGGYFLRHGKLGVVIDPGYDFIQHFYEAGLTPGMITHVIVTHDHYDHTASFGPLLNLLHKDRYGKSKQRFDKGSGQVGGKDLAQGACSELNVSFLLSRGVHDQYARFLTDFTYFADVKALTDRDANTGRQHRLDSASSGVVLHTTHTRHGESNGFGKGVGLMFTFSGNLPDIGITSDTGWYDDYQTDKDIDNGKSLDRVFANHDPDVMVLHIGSLKRDELRDSGYYKSHLGARGVFQIIDALLDLRKRTRQRKAERAAGLNRRKVKPLRLAVLSEFGEECRGHRKWFADRITEYFRKRQSDFRCFPSDRKTWLAGDSEGNIWIGRHDKEESLRRDCAAVKKRPDGTLRFSYVKPSEGPRPNAP